MSVRADLDLQLFIGRSSGTADDTFDHLPSFPFVPHGGARERLDEDGAVDVSVERETRKFPKYTVVANSEVVETVHLPFTGREVREMLLGLDSWSVRMHEYIDFGIRLFDFLFHRSIRDLYRELQQKAQREQRKVRVTIATSAPELLILPWEIMCDTYPQLLPSFLCHSPNLHLARALRLFNRADFKTSDLGDQDEVRILVVTAAPEGIEPIQVDMDEKLLRFVIAQGSDPGSVRLKHCAHATVATLRRDLHDFSPHVVHLACHAGYDSEEDLGFVVLVSSRDGISGDRIHSYRLATLLQESKDLQLVFVNSCFGAHQRASALSGVAQCLHAVGISNVVALQFRLIDTTAHSIVLNFYDYLFRLGCSVEGAVGELRRLMFIEGYLAAETFGITFFQTNTTLLCGRTARKESAAGADQFRATLEAFEKSFEDRITAELKTEPSIEDWEVNDWTLDYESGLTSYLSSAHEALGAWSLVIQIPRRFGHIFNLSEKEVAQPKVVNLFGWLLVQSAGLAKKMSAARFESQGFETAFAVTTKAGLEAYRKKYELEESQTSDSHLDLFRVSLKRAVKLALKVDGKNRSILIVVDPESRTYRTLVQSLAQVEKDPDAAFPQATARWAALQRFLRCAGGWAFMMPGGGRVKFSIQGEQLTEFVSGEWVSAQHRTFRRQTAQLAHELGLKKELLVDVVDKCLYAAELPKPMGKAILIQRSDDVLEKGVVDGFDPDLERFRDLKERPITEISAESYLQGGAGDRAVLISSEGYTLAVHTPLATSQMIDQKDGTGERHRSAQEATQKTDALAIVVSEDRPITIYLGGQKRLTFPVFGSSDSS